MVPQLRCAWAKKGASRSRISRILFKKAFRIVMGGGIGRLFLREDEINVTPARCNEQMIATQLTTITWKGDNAINPPDRRFY
jgi:3-phosphoglycerate kinase